MRMVKGLSILGLVLLSSCASLRGGGGSSENSTPVDGESLAASASESESRQELLRQVQGHMNRVEATGKDSEDTVIRKRPYFYKEYNEYPEDSASAEVILTETESRTSPLLAEVRVTRQRYSTKLHRSRDAAQIDDGFLRDTGTETLSYELRNGRWTRVGSFFLAETTEQRQGGQWEPVQRVLERPVMQQNEESQGWFGRTLSAITGR